MCIRDSHHNSSYPSWGQSITTKNEVDISWTLIKLANFYTSDLYHQTTTNGFRKWQSRSIACPVTTSCTIQHIRCRSFLIQLSDIKREKTYCCRRISLCRNGSCTAEAEGESIDIIRSVLWIRIAEILNTRLTVLTVKYYCSHRQVGKFSVVNTNIFANYN